MDWKVFTDSFQDSIEKEEGQSFLKQLLQIYTRTISESFDQTEKAVDSMDLKKISDLAHSMKSTYANLGFAYHSKLCQQMDLAAQKGDKAILINLWSQLNKVHPQSLSLAAQKLQHLP